mgnify:CR=1 FL=1
MLKFKDFWNFKTSLDFFIPMLLKITCISLAGKCYIIRFYHKKRRQCYNMDTRSDWTSNSQLTVSKIDATGNILENPAKDEGRFPTPPELQKISIP